MIVAMIGERTGMSATKFHKELVRYTDHAMVRHERCGLCEHYIQGGECEIVRGQISPGGWCNRFERAGYGWQQK